MNKFLLLFTMLSVFSIKAFSTARLQIIHNSADAAAAIVDIYVNGNLFLEDVAFRTATPFADVSSGVPLTIDLTPPNTSLSSSVFNKTVTLTNGETYVAIANGIVSGSGYLPASPFDIFVYALGRETSGSATETDVLVFHGATDAPTVDVVERGVGAGLIVNDLSYGQFDGYLDLPTLDFTLDVRTSNSLTTVASYSAPLATLNAGGAAAVVVASGFLNPGNNSGGPAFGLFAALPTGGALLQLPSVTASTGAAQVQVIHNSADAAANEVDVYINGSLAADNFAFRNATGFLPLPSEVDIEVAIAPAGSNSVADSLRRFNYKLADGEKYIIVANGTVQGSPAYNPFQPFNLFVYAPGRDASGNANETDILVFHGATDAPTVDVVERGVGAGLIVNDLSYGEFTGYLDLLTLDFTLDVRTSNSLTTVASYSAPLATLQAGGGAAVVVASGFLNPGNNSGGPAFGLFAALPTGGALLQLPSVTASTGAAQVQVIHNSADAAADSVDVYINGDLALNNFAFRNATGFLPLPSEIDIEVAIAGKNSSSVADSLRKFNYTLADGEKYIIIANGIVSQSGYSPATPFDLYVYTPARDESGDANQTDVLVFHGATDAPTVDVVETSVPAGPLVEDLSYGEFSTYLELPVINAEIDVRDETGTTTVASYSAPLASLNLGGAALTVVASGFLNPDDNSNGAAFGLYVAGSDGGPLLALPSIPVSVAGFETVISNITLFPNPTNSNVTLAVTSKEESTLSIVVTDMLGRTVMNNSMNITKGNQNFVMNVADLNTGVYQVKLMNAEINKTISFSKN